MDNIDHKETQKFESLAAEWWDKQGKCRTLHDINPTRLQFITDRCHTIEGKTILDVGCGAGILSESLAKRGAIVTGIDAGATLIQAAQHHAQVTQEQMSSDDYFRPAFSALSYHVASAEEYASSYTGKGLHREVYTQSISSCDKAPTKASSGAYDLICEQRAEPATQSQLERRRVYDIVVCMELLEHVPDPVSLIKACATLTKPGGHLFFSTLNRTMKSFAFAIVAAEYLLQLLPKRTHQYSKFIRPSELASALRLANVRLLELAGMQYNPFTRETRLTSDVSVNYLAHVLRTD